jgi:hypothetical protein
MQDLEGEAMAKPLSHQKYLQDRKPKRATPTSVACPVCGAKRGRLCTWVDTGRRRQHPHPERRQKARRVLRERQRRMAWSRGQRAKRWDGVRVYHECPACGGDHARADHAVAVDLLSARARRALAEAGQENLSVRTPATGGRRWNTYRPGLSVRTTPNVGTRSNTYRPRTSANVGRGSNTYRG